MNRLQIPLIPRLATAAIALTSFLAAQPPAPAPRGSQVIAILSVSAGVTREQIMPVMQEEVRDTVQLHLDGVIAQWYGRTDGKGVVFILNCATTAEAKLLLDKLPLIRQNLARFDYIEIGPLRPLGVLLRRLRVESRRGCARDRPVLAEIRCT